MNLRLWISVAVAATVGCSELRQPDGFPDAPAASPAAPPACAAARSRGSSFRRSADDR